MNIHNKNLTILYRGSLQTCNYTCSYCPFGEDAGEKKPEMDDHDLKRFVQWIRSQKTHTFSLFFTPRGEALVHPRYQEAVCTLSRISHVKEIVVQTNLSSGLSWLKRCRPDRVALWCSFHPEQVDPTRFFRQCRALMDMNIRFSVGAVALHPQRGALHRMRRMLPEHIYFWLNAFRHVRDYYTGESFDFYQAIDPLFFLNQQVYQTKGRRCRCGESVIAVNGDGGFQQCYFAPRIIGNIHEMNVGGLPRAACPNTTCHCHIGYIHLYEPDFYSLFQGGVLERIPHNWPDPDHLETIRRTLSTPLPRGEGFVELPGRVPKEITEASSA